MINARGAYLREVLTLAARDAAKRFAPLRVNYAVRRNSWRPIALRWRLRGKRAVQARANRSGRASFAWFPQFHFHYATHVTDRIRRERSTAVVPALGTLLTRVWLCHRWAGAAAAMAPVILRRGDRPSRSIDAKTRAVSKVYVWRPATGVSWPATAAQAATARLQRRREPSPSTATEIRHPSAERARLWRPVAAGLSRPPTARPILPLAAQRARAPAVERVTNRAAVRTHGDERSQSFSRHPRIRQRRLEMFTLAAPTPVEGLPNHLSERKRLQRPFDHPEELLWRNERRGASMTVENPARSDAVAGSAARSPAGREAAADLSRGIERAAAPHVTKLDPGLLDRLTDDVIRRMEQRMRIERQRRGL